MKTIFYCLWMIGCLSNCIQKRPIQSKSETWAETVIQSCIQTSTNSVCLPYIEQLCAHLQKDEDNQPNPEYWGGVAYHMPFFIEAIQRIKPSKAQVFLDVGSGNGEKLFASLCLGFEQAIGIEYNPELVKMSQQNFPQLHQKQKLHTYQGDALTIDPRLFGKADFIYLYSPIKNDRKMAQLLERVMCHMKNGAIILEVNAYYCKALQQVSHLAFPKLQDGWLAIKKEARKYFVAQTFYNQGAEWLPLTPKSK